MIWDSESKRVQASKTHCFVISIPQGVQCRPPCPIDFTQPTNPEELYYRYFPLHYFTPAGDNTYYIELSGDLISLLASKNAVKFAITLSSALNDPATAFSISLATSPSTKVLVGYIADSNPSFQLNYPFPKMGTVNYVKIELSRRRLADILLELPKEGGVVESEHIVGMDLTKMVVCNGEVHSFDVQKDETLGRFLQRAARRWNANVGGYEIQDLNYQTYPDEMTFTEYNAKGGSHIVRLVPKTSATPTPTLAPTPGNQGPFMFPQTGGVAPAFLPGAQQQQHFPVNKADNQVFKWN